MVQSTIDYSAPDFTFNDNGLLNRACHITATVRLFHDEAETPFKVIRHRCVLVPDVEGVWNFEPHPVRSDTGAEFDVPAETMTGARAVIEAMVTQYGLAAAPE